MNNSSETVPSRTLEKKYKDKIVSIEGLEVWGYLRGMSPPEGIQADVQCVVTLQVIDKEFTSGEPEYWDIPCDLEEIVVHTIH